MWVELVIPHRLIIRVVHVELLVVDALVVPLAHLIEDVHLLRARISIDHVQVQAGVLLEEGAERGRTPIVILRDGDQLSCRHVRRLNSIVLQSVELEHASLGVELCAHDEALGREVGLEEEGEEGEHFGLVVCRAKTVHPGAAPIQVGQLLELDGFVEGDGGFRSNGVGSRLRNRMVAALLSRGQQ